MPLDGQMSPISTLELKTTLVAGHLTGNISLTYTLLADNQTGYVTTIYTKTLLWRTNGHYTSKINEVCYKNVKNLIQQQQIIDKHLIHLQVFADSLDANPFSPHLYFYAANFELKQVNQLNLLKELRLFVFLKILNNFK